MSSTHLTTGIPGLDRILRTLLPGDNIVWQIGSTADYAPLARPFCRAGLEAGKQVIYFRFAEHPPLLEADSGADIRVLRPQEGFEQFIREIHQAIDATRNQGVYIFDCLSELAADWYSDRMLSNCFLLMCPYVYDVEGLACFAMLRHFHSQQAFGTISDTTQIFIDVYRHNDRVYFHPMKVQQRHSPTMYMLHVWDGDEIRPVMDSATNAEILKSIRGGGPQAARARLGVWDRTFLQAEQALETGALASREPSEVQMLRRRLLRMAVTRDERVLALAERYLDVADVLDIWHRMIGTGLIGGKAAGMLIARAILVRSNPRWRELLEEHDSFFIGSDVFYSYLVRNGCWWLRERQRNPASFLEGAEEARRRIQTGSFPPEVQRGFAEMLDYFGQSPIIVRSSSLLEDAFGNSFAGKYDSVFCVNQGSRDKRLEDFMSAVRTVYASTMSEKALRYRARRGMLDRDEQMSLLVQRVSGSLCGHLFSPDAAGVGLSFNPYVWNEEIDPEAGVARIVFGLGTRAVDRSDDDYTRVVALNAPQRRPEAGLDEVRRYSQRKVDVLDLAANQLVSMDFPDVAAQRPDLPMHLFASRDEELVRMMAEAGRPAPFPWILTFEGLLAETSCIEDLRAMLKTLEEAYGCPVDTEFTLNFFEGSRHRVNLVQCRPMQVSMSRSTEQAPASIPEERTILAARGAVVGKSLHERVDRLIFVSPAVYGRLPVGERYAVARLIGRLMHLDTGQRVEKVLLMGPGRWGTTTPSLGVPVSYAEISKVAFLCEIVAMHEGLVPDVSLGTHFFNELIEAEILYLALFPGRPGHLLNEAFLARMPNRLADLLPDAAGRADVVRVIDAADLPPGEVMQIFADSRGQEVLCYLRSAP